MTAIAARKGCLNVAGAPGDGSGGNVAEVGEVVEGRDDGGKVVERVVLARALQGVVFEDGGDGDLGAVQGVLDQPPAALRAVDAALRLGVHHPPAGAGIEGQVDTDAAQLARLAGAAHVLAVGEALAQSPQPLPVRGTEHVDQCHRVLRG